MPNHFHLLAREEVDKGISDFMQRVGTSFAKYYNTKYRRVGNLFVKPFRARHVASDRYLRRVAEYIHLNPVELYEPDFKTGSVVSLYELHSKLHAYPYSSLREYHGVSRNTSSILNTALIDALRLTEHVPVTRLLEERREYYAELSMSGSVASGHFRT